MWVYLLKEKSCAFETFKKFKMMVEKGKERSIKMLRTDRGGSFAQKNLQFFVKKLV